MTEFDKFVRRVLANPEAQAAYDAAELRHTLATADQCYGIVYRGGDGDVCGKQPVAIVDGRGTEDETFWPACAYHANRYGHGKCVPLADLVATSKGMIR